MASKEKENRDAAGEPAIPTIAAELLETLHRISAQYCLEEGGSHGPDHSERVLHTAMSIGEKMGARLDIIAPAALLHDIGRKQESSSKGKVCHAELGAEMAEPILQELGYTEADRAAICHCIRAHRFRNNAAPETIEAKILFDADKLDSIGAIGIGRAFLFAGQIGARLHNAEIDPADTETYSTEDTAYREFQVKMSKVREQMLTPLGRQIAERRHAFMETFFSELHREIYGSE
ncbi:MAG: HD domain-containing protein [Candidatus Electrothrix aestuarii]|uniref:HD domain-containing protein n=1 Tax=Candidatus Electrothrix aestuarii TaxID=3062594 RepID=A0AAU8M0H0_9BACT|nr:HD domain-containing protein [Candidatus Electrothrix aestuarii]